MKKLIMGGAVILSSGFAGIAVAAPITWDTIKDLTSPAYICSGGSCEFTTGGEIVKASAYATSDGGGSGAFQKATINLYTGGIGVTSPFESTGSPQHSTDNSGKDEMVVFEYDDTGYKPTGFEIGWKSGDADIRAWIGGETLGAGYDFTGEHFSDLSSGLSGLGFTLINNFYNVPINTFMAFNTNDTGRYLILAPQQKGSGFDKASDYFKISQISGTVAVPEPGTAALLGIALAGFWANRRRKS